MTAYPGKKKRRRVKKLRLDEISMVDRPQHAPARIAIMKRAADTPVVEKRLALTTLEDGHSHLIVGESAHSDSLAELRAGQTSFVDGHTHDWIKDEAGNLTIGDANGHSHGIATFVTKGGGTAIENILVESMLASLAPVEPQAGITKAAEGGAESTMTPEEKAAFEKAAEDKLNIEKARADRAESVVKLSPEAREYFNKLDAADQDEFLGAKDQDAIVKIAVAAAADADPVVHTDLDGNEIRKSEGPTVLRLAKQNDELRKNAAKSEAIAKRAGFEKRAGDELKHLTGDASAKADLLEAVDSLPVEKRAAVEAILKSKDAGMAKAFQTIGTSDDGNGEGADANSKMDAIAKRYNEAHPNLSPEQSYSAALDTPEGRELHAQLVG